MILTLLSHQWKAFWRSRNAGTSVALRIFLGFIIAYLLATCLLLGLNLHLLLTDLFPGRQLIPVFCSFILYYFSIDIVLRFYFQNLPSLAVQPYLKQNIRRSQLVAFLNLRSLAHFLNFLPFLLCLPFIFTDIQRAFGPAGAAAMTLSLFSFVGFNHFGMLYIMRKGYFNGWWIVGLVVVVGLTALADRFRLFALDDLSAGFFLHILHTPVLAVMPLALAILAFANNYFFLRRNLYIEELSKGGRQRRSTEYAFLRKWGVTGELAELDIKLMLRNKRSKSTFVFCWVLLFYGFIFYRPIYMHPMHYGILLMAALLITGGFILNFGRFGFSWQSAHFDGLLASNLEIHDYIRGKFLLYTLVSTVTTLLALAYGFIDWRLIPIQVAAWLYNIGCTSVITMWKATYNYKSIDLSKSGVFNYQGTGGSLNLLLPLLIILPPMTIFLVLDLLFNPWAGFAAIGIIGLTSLLLRNVWINRIEKEFYKRKHLILQGFREK